MPHPESDPALLSRIELLRLAHSLGVLDADVMTRAELRAAIDEARRFAPRRQEPATTWVSVARRLLASIVERGLNLPDTAALIRGGPKPAAPRPPPPVATVTLARIYAAQGHLERAIRTLEEVLETEPDHDLARELRDQLAARRDSLVQAGLYGSPAGTAPAAGEEEAEADSLERVGTDSEAPSEGPPEREASPAAGSVSEAGAARLAHGVEPAWSGNRAGGPDPAGEAGELVAPAFGVVEHAAERALEATREAGEAAFEAAAPDLTEPAPPSASVLEGDAAAAATEPAPAEPARPSDFREARTQARELETEPPATLATSSGSEPGGAEPEPHSPTEPAPHPSASPAALAAASTPLETGASAPAAAPSAPAPAPPSVPALVMIETDSPSSYLYWELPPPQSPHWIVVVVHAAAVGARPERRERRFAVQRSRGALRLEGLPRHAVVRASLMQDPAAGAVLAVAGAVRRTGETVEVRHRPHARCQPEDLARRAEPLLDGAARVYWD